jgi:predicted outer membrane protein
MGKLNGLMVVLAEIVLVTLPVEAQEPPAQPTGPDQELVTRLHQLGQDEIAAAAIGVTRGEREGVRSFAAQVQREQRVADDRLLAYAARKNMNRVAVAESGGALPHGTLALAPLANSTRAEFDYNFTARMVADHQAAIDVGAAAERLARDPELKALIGANLKMQSQHLVSAQELAGQIPAPSPRVVQLPAYPAGVSRTQTGADVPPPAALAR